MEGIDPWDSLRVRTDPWNNRAIYARVIDLLDSARLQVVIDVVQP